MVSTLLQILLLLVKMELSLTLDNTNKDKSSSKMKLPTIHIIGVQKGGTSSLYEMLVRHPLLCGGRKKESHFFDYEGRYERGVSYYQRFYADPRCLKNSKARFVDATPLLHLINSTRERIEAVYSEYDRDENSKDWKFIALLREPVARDFSWYQHKVRDQLAKGAEFRSIRTFQDIQREECSSIISKTCSRHRRGNYVEQLRLFTEVFRRDQLLVLNSNTLFHNPRALEVIRRFLQLPSVKAWREPFPHDDHFGAPRFQGIVECVRTHTPSLDCPLRDTLASYYEPRNSELYRWLNQTRHKNPYEPYFIPFGSGYKNITCIADARVAFNLVLESSAAGSQSSCQAA